MSDVKVDITVFLPNMVQYDKLKGKHKSSRYVRNKHFWDIRWKIIISGSMLIELNWISLWVRLLWSLYKRVSYKGTFIFYSWIVVQHRCNFSIICGALYISGVHWEPAQPTWWVSLLLLLPDLWQALWMYSEKKSLEK